uniref:Putative secreted protein n=1 Tax=Anopheles marajoara TaxID=58244 RepID=A0A2M4CF33_9DIPT
MQGVKVFITLFWILFFVNRNPVASIRKLTKEANISRSYMHWLTKDHLKPTSRARMKRQLIIERKKSSV